MLPIIASSLATGANTVGRSGWTVLAGGHVAAYANPGADSAPSNTMEIARMSISPQKVMHRV
jgi:hypothetical protein